MTYTWTVMESADGATVVPTIAFHRAASRFSNSLLIQAWPGRLADGKSRTDAEENFCPSSWHLRLVAKQINAAGAFRLACTVHVRGCTSPLLSPIPLATLLGSTRSPALASEILEDPASAAADSPQLTGPSGNHIVQNRVRDHGKTNASEVTGYSCLLQIIPRRATERDNSNLLIGLKQLLAGYRYLLFRWQCQVQDARPEYRAPTPAPRGHCDKRAQLRSVEVPHQSSLAHTNVTAAGPPDAHGINFAIDLAHRGAPSRIHMQPTSRARHRPRDIINAPGHGFCNEVYRPDWPLRRDNFGFRSSTGITRADGLQSIRFKTA